MRSKVIAIILTYKHAKYLEKVYQSLPKDVFDEIIISNDESGDAIEVIAEKLGIKCFSHRRLGYGGNLKYGLKKAMEHGGEYMVEIHGDGQFDVNCSKIAVPKALEGYDFLTGSRFTDLKQPLRDKMPLIRYMANISLSTLGRIVTGARLSEFQNGFRIYSKNLLDNVALDKTSDNFLFAFQIIAQVKFKNMKIGEIPIRSFYFNEHTSISMRRSVAYAFGTLGVLFKYILAKLGFKIALFK